MHSVGRLKIIGHESGEVPNTIFKQDRGAEQLAIVYPGYSYRCSEPLLWYPTRILLSLGADVLWVEYPYDSDPKWEKSSEQAQRQWLFDDSLAAFKIAVKRRPYRRITLVGKSLGTLAIARVLALEPTDNVKAIWMTPVLTDTNLTQQLEMTRCMSLIVIGSADHYYDSSLLERLRKKAGMEIFVVQGGDHILQTGAGLVGSIDALKHVVETVQRFVSR